MKDLAKDFGIGGAQLALSVTAALSTAWVLNQQAGGHPQAAAEPRLTATVTASAPPGVRRSPHPSPRPSTGAVVAAGRDAAGNPGGAQGGRPGTVAPSGPSPVPRPPASGRSGAIRAAVWLSHPLGVLPDAHLALTVGGTR